MIDRVGDSDRRRTHDEPGGAGLGQLIIGDLRTFDQDPRFGLIVMGRLPQRRCHRAVNDPGTAIDMITRIGRVLRTTRTRNGAERDEFGPIYVNLKGFRSGPRAFGGQRWRDGCTVVEVRNACKRP